MDAVRLALSWLLALFIVFIFVQATIHPLPDPPIGQVKLYDLPGENIVFQTIASRSGITFFEPTGRVLTAVLELLAAALLIVPWTRRLGAALATAILGSAVLFHLTPWLGREVPVSLAAEAGRDGGQLFMLAIATLVASIMVLVVHPRPRRRLKY